MIHITFDLETLGTNSESPIVQIAAVAFDIDGSIKNKFNRHIDLSSLQKYNFKIDYSTLKFWFTLPDEAIKSVMVNSIKAYDIKNAMREFASWIGFYNRVDVEYTVWSHSTFDPPILMNAMRQCEVRNPIAHSKFGDIRTLQKMTTVHKPLRGPLVHHNAMDDCLYQASYIAAMLKELNDKGILI